MLNSQISITFLITMVGKTKAWDQSMARHVDESSQIIDELAVGVNFEGRAQLGNRDGQGNG